MKIFYGKYGVLLVYFYLFVIIRTRQVKHPLIFYFIMANRLKKILIVEDDIAISGMYQIKLEKSGYRVFIANDGIMGLEMAKSELPDLILLDVIMPQLDGFSVLESLKQNEETKNIPVILLTNLGTEEDREKGKLLGAADYWIKVDIDSALVTEKIEKYLQ